MGTGTTGAERTGSRFGLSLAQWPVDCWNDVPLITRYITAGVVQVPAWRRDMSENGK